MVLLHAQPLDVIDLRPLGSGLRNAVTTSLLNGPTLQLQRLVLPAGHGMPETGQLVMLGGAFRTLFRR